VPKSLLGLIGTKRKGGDGGNRTRVRKTRPTEIYERSCLSFVVEGIPISQDCLQPVAWTRKPSFTLLATSSAALHHCFALTAHRVEYGSGGRGLIYGDRLLRVRLGGEGHSSVGSAVGT
jgi:hypothetical protein